jgi:HD superfamily phosphohydrolase
MAYRHQRVRDPIHNLIEFRAGEFEDAMWRVIQTRPFQRLRRIKQLGFSEMIYPGATHTRYAHSLGVFHTARQLMAVIKENQTEFKQTKAERALAAALVHDVGHGPFSHAFEEFGIANGLRLASHEAVSDRLIRDSEIADVLKSLGSGFHDDVATVISAEGPQSIYDAVVSSQFDADRLDYMRRDRVMAGSSHGVIDYDWLVSNLRIGKVAVGIDEAQIGEIDTFVIGTKAIFAADTYVLGLFQLYPAIYFHKATRGIEKIFSEILNRCFQMVTDGSAGQTGLPDNHPLIRFMKNPEDLDRVLELDDAIFTGALSMMAQSTDKKVSEFSLRIRDRKLLKCFDLRVEAQRRTKLPVSDDSAQIQLDQIVSESVKGVNDWKAECGASVFYDGYSRSPYKKVQQSKGPLNQIMVQEPDGSLVDLGVRSRAVSAIRAYRLDRIYYDPEDAASKAAIESILDGVCDHVQ